MPEPKNHPENERLPAQEGSSEPSKSVEKQREERLSQIDVEASALQSSEKGTVEHVQKTKEEESKTEQQDLERELGPISEKSRTMIHENIVNGPVDIAQKRAERSRELATEKDALVLESALEKILPYHSPEIRAVAASERYEKDIQTYGTEEATEVALIGAAHTNDPESPLIKDISEAAREFLEKNPKDAVFMIEGMGSADIAKEMKDIESEADAIKKHGEKGALMWTAKERGIEIASPEKPDTDIAKEMIEKGRAPQDVALYLTIRQFTSDIGRAGESKPEESQMHFAKVFLDIQKKTGVEWISDVGGLMRELQSAAGESDPTMKAQKIKPLMEKITDEFTAGLNGRFQKIPGMEQKPLVPSREALLSRDGKAIPMDEVNDLHDPADAKGKGSVINEISAAWNNARDQHLVRSINDALKKGKKPFVLFGAFHTTVIKPAIAELVKRHTSVE